MIAEYHATYAVRARDLCMAGLTEVEIAAVLCISVGTLRAWRQHYADFEYAWLDGTTIANTRVVGALFKKALGYDVIKWKETKDGMMREQVHVEPHFQSCAFWLTNKCPDQWQNKVEHDLTPGAGKALENMSDAEAARRVAFVLAKAVYEQNRSIEDGSPTDQTETK